MASRKPPIVVDWDGTCVEGRWPDQGDWLPGAVEALRYLSEVCQVRIHSCRVSPWEYPDTMLRERDPAVVAGEINRIRSKLDEAGLRTVEIWTKPGKPSGIAYIDDLGIRFNGKNWKAITQKIAAMVGDDREL